MNVLHYLGDIDLEQAADHFSFYTIATLYNFGRICESKRYWNSGISHVVFHPLETALYRQPDFSTQDRQSNHFTQCFESHFCVCHETLITKGKINLS